jgi:hypothetical protein
MSAVTRIVAPVQFRILEHDEEPNYVGLVESRTGGALVRLAAGLSGRKFIGIDLNPAYLEIARLRLLRNGLTQERATVERPGWPVVHEKSSPFLGNGDDRFGNENEGSAQRVTHRWSVVRHD